MKTKTNLAAFALCLALNLQFSTTFGQGSLTPPGAPAPTMKSLDQIEARTPILSAPFNITQSGSYYLTTNLSVGGFNYAITIAANGVTLDLNGFTISSSNTSGNSGGGVYVSGSDISIGNGHIVSGVTNNGSGTYSGPGFLSGIYPNPLVQVRNVHVSGVIVAGVLNYGIYLPTENSTLVENCQVRTAGSYGIQASTVKSSIALDIGGTAIIGDRVSDCRGESAVNGNGISASFTVRDSYGWATNDNDAIECTGTAQNCFGYSYGLGNGVHAESAENCKGLNFGGGDGIVGSAADNCYGRSSGGIGIEVFCALNCYGDSDGAAGYGIEANTAQNCLGVCATGTGLDANIATGCSGTSLNVTHNLNSY